MHTRYFDYYSESKGQDNCSHAITNEYSYGNTNLEICQPHSLFIFSVFIDPDWIIDQQKYLTYSGHESTDIGCCFMAAQNKKQEKQL